MHSIINWIKSNKLSSIFILLFVYMVLKQPIRQFFYGRSVGSYSSLNVMDTNSTGYGYSKEKLVSEAMPDQSYSVATPQPDIEERMVVKSAGLSLFVKNVRDTISEIETYTKSIGGYLVDKSLNEPRESSTGYVTLRVPSEKMEEALAYFGKKAVRVVNESVYGADITDQYTDTQAQLEILEKTKAIFVGMLNQATTFDQTLRAQREILSVQTQIDDVKGQIEYMKATAKTSLISIDLSTDELELGYAPADSWRPGVIFKMAIRNLIANIRKIGNLTIWAGVYGIIWIPALIVVLVLKKRRQAKKADRIAK